MSSRQHSERKTFRTRLRAAMTVVVAVAAVLVPAAQPANAVTPADVVSAVRTAYDVYNKLFNHQLTTAEATTQIIAPSSTRPRWNSWHTSTRSKPGT